jgi:hypothetical protein
MSIAAFKGQPGIDRSRALDIQEAQTQLNQQTQATTRASSFMNEAAVTINDILKSARDSGIDVNDEKVQASIEPLMRSALTTGESASKAYNIDFVEPFKAKVRASMGMPTLEQEREQAALSTKSTNKAEVIGASEGETEVLPQTLENERQSKQQDLDIARASRDPTDLLLKISRLGSDLLKEGQSIEQVIAAYDTLIEANPENAEALSALKSALPISRAAQLGDMTRDDILAAAPLIETLVANGQNRKDATAMILGQGSFTVQKDANAEELGEIEKRKARDGIRTTQAFVTKLERLIPLINDDSIGIFAGPAEVAGGVIQQVPGLRNIFNAFDNPFDETSVDNASLARKDFRKIIGPVADFIINNPGRVSVQALELAKKSLGLLEANTTPKQAKLIVQGLVDAAKGVIKVDSAALKSGRVLLDNGDSEDSSAAENKNAQITEVKFKDGKLQGFDAEGNFIRFIEAQ